MRDRAQGDMNLRGAISRRREFKSAQLYCAPGTRTMSVCSAQTNRASGRVGMRMQLRFDDLISHRVADQFAHSVQLQLAHDVGAVRFGRLHTDVERRRDFLAALPFRK